MRSGWDMLSNEFQWEDVMGGNVHDEDLQKPAVAVEAAQPQPVAKREVKLLICKCESCTTWEIGDDSGKLFILCKTCGLEAPIKQIEIDDHHMLHWMDHER